MVKKIWILTARHFAILQGFCLIGYGTKELVCDRIQISSEFSVIRPNSSVLFEKTRQFDDLSSGYYAVHGSLYVSSGVFSVLTGVQNLNMLNFGVGYPLLHLAGNGLFLVANLLTLDYSIAAFHYYSNLPDGLEERTYQQKVAALFGIVSSIGYLLMGLSMSFGFSFAFTFIFGCLAVTSGCIKILYENGYLLKKLIT